MSSVEIDLVYSFKRKNKGKFLLRNKSTYELEFFIYESERQSVFISPFVGKVKANSSVKFGIRKVEKEARNADVVVQLFDGTTGMYHALPIKFGWICTNESFRKRVNFFFPRGHEGQVISNVVLTQEEEEAQSDSSSSTVSVYTVRNFDGELEIPTPVTCVICKILKDEDPNKRYWLTDCHHVLCNVCKNRLNKRRTRTCPICRAPYWWQRTKRLYL